MKANPEFPTSQPIATSAIVSKPKVAFADATRPAQAEYLRRTCEKIAAISDTEEIFKWVSRIMPLAQDLAAREEIGVLPYRWAGDVAPVTTCNDFVEGLLTEGGLSVIYGESNCGKSFFALEIAASVATGAKLWGEHETVAGAVVYVAFEGTHGIQNRFAALSQSGRLFAGAPLALVTTACNLLVVNDALKLAGTVCAVAEAQPLPVRMVILDTLSRSMAGGDENAASDMTAVVAAADKIRSDTGAHVCFIHHAGKDSARGARGHSSLRAATDTEIEIVRGTDGVAVVHCRKQRDLEFFKPLAFTLDVVELGTNSRGNPVTSCVLRHEPDIMIPQAGKAGRPRGVSCAELIALLPQPSTKEWERVAKEETGISKGTFYERKKEIETARMAHRLPNIGSWQAATIPNPKMVQK